LEEYGQGHGQYRGISREHRQSQGRAGGPRIQSLEIYYAEKETDVDVVVADIKREIEEIQWQMAALDELWDELILGRPRMPGK
jgi:hypothetical protein